MTRRGVARAAGGAPRDESGQIFPAMAVVVLGLLAFTLYVVVPLGSGADRRAEVTTAADAAALAALTDVAESVRGIGTLVPPGLGGDPGDGDALVAVFDGLEERACDRARQYAADNNAELADCDVTVDLPYVTAYAATRHDSTVEDTELRLTAEATAEMEVLSGLCRAADGIGVLLEDGSCSGLDDLVEVPEPPDPPEPSGPPRPSEPPGGDGTDGPEPEPEQPPGIGLIELDQPVLVE